jgi:HKD family nuclease
VTVTAQVLFGMPQHEIASMLRDRLARCDRASLVAGFMTVEGMEAIAPPLRAHPGKLADLVVGAATWRAFDALDGLSAAGVAPTALRVHLGHSRATTAGATYRFYRYHPMLHSKVYLMDMGDGTSAAFIGSHNLTGFALLGLNGEAAVLLEGPSNEPQFVAIRQHIAEAVAQATPYDPAMKDAYAWWTTQFLEGLRDKTRDTPDPDDAENKRTVVVIAARASSPLPKKGDIIYFEVPSALRVSIRSLDTEVHIYLFATLPPSPAAGLSSLGTATKSLWCTTAGLESDGGGTELDADWFIDDRRQPELKRTTRPFRPHPLPGMEQVRVRVRNSVFGKFEYLFDRGRRSWLPEFDADGTLALPQDARDMLVPLNLIPPEDQPWQRVRRLVPGEPEEGTAYSKALVETSPESGAYVLFSLRRRSERSRQGGRRRGQRQPR